MGSNNFALFKTKRLKLEKIACGPAFYSQCQVFATEACGLEGLTRTNESKEQPEENQKVPAVSIGSTGSSRSTPLPYFRAEEYSKTWTSKICGKGSTHKSHQNAHLMVHSSKRPFSCKSCVKAFKLKSDCKKHEAIHRPVNPFPCTVCDRRYSRKDNQQVHI